jgi:formylglycine-generating enzyme required for sulfatase activity
MVGAVEIPPDHYEIGNESVPNAAPRHLRKLDDAVWIDACPVSWAHFEVFVAAGGYACEEFWPSSVLPTNSSTGGVDGRCRFLLEQAESFRRQFKSWSGGNRDHPITGLTWLEAAAVAQFFGARLPFEVEWEVAMTLSQDAANSAPGQLPAIRTGCPILVGLMQEWTRDAFAPMYYRADFSSRGIPWSPESGGTLVTVRGASPYDLYQHIATRIGRNPLDGHAYCGFRRVWDHPPTKSELAPEWR